jgi:hypothetical protein
MAKKKISALPEAGSLSGAEILPIVQSGTTKQTTIQDIVTLVETEGGINGSGTANKIPRFIDENTIGDSSISDDLTILQTYSGESGGNEGLKLDYANRSYKLGEFDYNVNGTIFEVNDDLKFISTKYSGNNIGLNINFDEGRYSLGDFDFANTGSAYNVLGYTVYTSSEGQAKGLGIDFDGNCYTLGLPEAGDFNSGVVGFNLINDYITIGDKWGAITATKLEIDLNNRIIQTSDNYGIAGLYFDLTAYVQNDSVATNAIGGSYLQFPNANTYAITNLAGNQTMYNHNFYSNDGLSYMAFGQYGGPGEGGATFNIVLDAGGWGSGGQMSFNNEEGFLLQIGSSISMYSVSNNAFFYGVETIIGNTNKITLSDISNNIVIETSAIILSNGLTTSQINLLANPLQRQVVYNTTLGTYCFYDGSNWKKISHSAM